MHNKGNETGINELILQKLKEKDRSMAWLARKLHCDDANLGKTLKKSQFIYFDLILRLSLALEEDFFAYGTQLLEGIKSGKIHLENW